MAAASSTTTHHHASFVDVLRCGSKNAIDFESLPQPCFNGDTISIKLSQEAYSKGLNKCKLRLPGRIVLPKGALPMKLGDLRKKIQEAWKISSHWCLISLGKGYFEFAFQSQEDMIHILSIGVWSLKPGSLRVFAWTKDFSPNHVKNTMAQVWLKIFDLPQEYWEPSLLFSIACGFGNPICLDGYTQKACNAQLEHVTFGHYAKILIDLDLSKDLRYEILVEREAFNFYVSVDYENLPQFCAKCYSIGHSMDSCKKGTVVHHPSPLLKDGSVMTGQGHHSTRISGKNSQIYVAKKIQQHDVPSSSGLGVIKDHDAFNSNLDKVCKKHPAVSSFRVNPSAQECLSHVVARLSKTNAGIPSDPINAMDATQEFQDFGAVLNSKEGTGYSVPNSVPNNYVCTTNDSVIADCSEFGEAISNVVRTDIELSSDHLFDDACNDKDITAIISKSVMAINSEAIVKVRNENNSTMTVSKDATVQDFRTHNSVGKPLEEVVNSVARYTDSVKVVEKVVEKSNALPEITAPPIYGQHSVRLEPAQVELAIVTSTGFAPFGQGDVSSNQAVLDNSVKVAFAINPGSTDNSDRMHFNYEAQCTTDDEMTLVKTEQTKHFADAGLLADVRTVSSSAIQLEAVKADLFQLANDQSNMSMVDKSGNVITGHCSIEEDMKMAELERMQEELQESALQNKAVNSVNSAVKTVSLGY